MDKRSHLDWGATFYLLLVHRYNIPPDESTCRIVTYLEELASIYISYSTGDWFNTPLFGCILSTYVQYHIYEAGIA